MDNKNFKRFGVCVYINLKVFFVAVNYLLYMIITIGALLISEKTNLNYFLSMTQELLRTKFGEVITGAIVVLSIFLVFIKLWEWWINFDKFLIDKKTAE